jgi:hypothetical protein
MLDLALNIQLPETLQFLNPGWIILHLVAAPTVFLIGMAVGKRRQGKTAGAGSMSRAATGALP